MTWPWRRQREPEPIRINIDKAEIDKALLRMRESFRADRAEAEARKWKKRAQEAEASAGGWHTASAALPMKIGGSVRFGEQPPMPKGRLAYDLSVRIYVDSRTGAERVSEALFNSLWRWCIHHQGVCLEPVDGDDEGDGIGLVGAGPR